MDHEIIKHFGNKLRIRVCGIVIDNGKVLLVKHHYLGENSVFWSPPGGGLQYGESVHDGLKREFKEETGLEIRVLDFLFVYEFLRPPLHAIELFFHVQVESGSLQTGMDPELAAGNQIIADVKYLTLSQIGALQNDEKHGIFENVTSMDALLKRKSCFEG